jgi:hypothetical protein
MFMWNRSDTQSWQYILLLMLIMMLILRFGWWLPHCWLVLLFKYMHRKRPASPV